MKTTVAFTLSGVLLALLAVQTPDVSATLYCNRSYSELKANSGKPYNAVGFLNNGCTAFLIDANHIVAAAHCFEDTTTGAWQTGLRFYPNFHPSRVAADEKQVPRGDVTRAVVGSRAAESVLGAGMDWGIARVDNWRDTTGLDMSPLSLAASVPASGTALMNPAYTRHHFPYNDNDGVTWDNMEWDTTNCGWVGSHHGMWALKMHTAPIYDGAHRDTVGCNSRWAPGLIHADCSLTKVDNDVIVHDCDTVGGSSGSPIMYEATKGRWRVVGVGHGGGPTDFSELVPTCVDDIPARRDNVGASVERFRDAPRFASNVAVHRRPDKSSATAIFAVDADLNRVVYRYREGTAPSYAGKFSFWKSLGTPYRGAEISTIAACSAGASAQPQVFVVVGNRSIYTRYIRSKGRWSAWSNFGIPSSVSSVADIDAAADAQGRCMLFMVANGGGAYTRAKTSDTAWTEWFTVAAGPYRNVTALNYNGKVWAALIDTAGAIWRSSLGQAGWSSPTKLSMPGGVNAWRDIDLTWDEHARGFMLATPAGGGNRLYFVPLYGNAAWNEWRFFETHLWAPGATVQDAPTLQTVTASRWMEDPSGTTSPVVFATDDSGNVYFIEYARVGTSGWNLDWKSFYHETIMYK